MASWFQRIAIYAAAFFIPPILLGAVVLFKSMSRIMTHRPPAPLAETIDTLVIEKPKTRFRALIVLGSAGTQTSDLLSTYEVLSESGLFEVRVAGPATSLLPTTGSLAIVPDFDLKSAPPAELLVIPGVITHSEKELIDWLSLRAREAQMVLALSDGVKLAAQAGLLRGEKQERSATAHFLSLEDLHAIEPTVDWVPDRRYVAHGKLVTSPGISSSIDAALYVIERMAGPKAAQETARELSFNWKKETEELPSPPYPPATRLTSRDLSTLFLRGGYDWSKRQIGVLLYPGISEIGLAAILDTLPRSLSANVFSVAAERRPIVTRHGLQVVPTETFATAWYPELLVVASGLGPYGTPPETNPMTDPALNTWVKQQNILVKNLLFDSPGNGYAAALDLLGQVFGSQRLRELTEKTMVYRPASRDAAEVAISGSADSHLRLWVWPMLLGSICLGIAVFFDYRISRRRKLLVATDTR